MEGADPFTNMMIALQGVTVLAAPRVPRETIIAVLKDHTTMIKDLKLEMSKVSDAVSFLQKEASETKKEIHILHGEIGNTRRELEVVQKVTAECRAEINIINEKMVELYPLKEEVKAQKRSIERLNSDLMAQATMLSDHVSKNKKEMHDLRDMHRATETKLEDLKKYVDSFGENLMLTSSQITVASNAGFAGKTMVLQDVLQKISGMLGELETNVTSQGIKINTNEEILQTKADQSIVFEVEAVTRKMEEVEKTLKKEEEQGVSVLRRQCENLTGMVESLQFELTDKVSHETVDTIVHKKYEEIVQYLQDALSATAQDELNFKQKAEELRDWVVKLSNAKADRVELGPMQEMIVRAEAMLNKVAASQGMNKDGKPNKEMYSRKELDALFELKVDKSDLEGLLNEKGRRGRRLAPVAGTAQADVEDEALRMGSSHSRGVSRDKAMWKGISEGLRAESDMTGRAYTAHSLDGIPPLGGLQEHPLDRQERAVWKGLADAMKGESEEAFIAAAEARGIDPAVAQQEYRKLSPTTDQLTDLNGVPIPVPGQLSSEAAGAGPVPGAGVGVLPDITGASSVPNNSGNSGKSGRGGKERAVTAGGTPVQYVGAGGTGGGAAMKGSVKFVAHGGGPSGPGQDFRSYAGSKKSAGFPSNSKPGAFRVASEGGRPGGMGMGRAPSSSSIERPSMSEGGVGAGGMIMSASADFLPGTMAGAMRSAQGPPMSAGLAEYEQWPADPQDYGIAGGLPVEVSDRDVTYLGGQFVGGGFNLRAGNALRQTALMPLNIADPGAPDVTDNSLMVKGNDGRFYMTDEVSLGSGAHSPGQLSSGVPPKSTAGNSGATSGRGAVSAGRPNVKSYSGKAPQ